MIIDKQNSQQLLKCKQEQLHIQIRRQERENLFKKKRIVQQSHIENNLQFNNEVITKEEEVEEYLNTCMQMCYRLYSDSTSEVIPEIIGKLKELKTFQIVQEEYKDTFLYCYFKQQFTGLLLHFIDKQFDHQRELQEIAAIILSNLFGIMTKTSKYYNSSYIPMLNLLKKPIINNFGRFLFIKNDQLIKTAIYALGNIFQDQFDLVQEFKNQYGLLSLFQLSNHNEQLLWVIEHLTDRQIDFTNSELSSILNIIDHELPLNNPEDIVYSMNSLANLTEYIDQAIDYIVKIKNFNLIFKFLQGTDTLNLRAFQIICALPLLSDEKQLKEIILQHNLIEMISTQLSCFNREKKLTALHTLKILSNKSSLYALQIARQDNLIEKLISSSVSNDGKIVLHCLTLIAAMVGHGDLEINSKFINKNLIPLLKQTLDYMNDAILQYTLQIIYSILQQINHYMPEDQDITGNEIVRSKIYILGQINANKITEKMAQVYMLTKSEEIQQQLEQCLEIIDESQNYIDNY